MPFAGGPRADACGSCGGPRGVVALDPSSNQLSTIWCQTGILVDVHPVLRGIAEVSQLQSPRSGPDGQPTESPHLGGVVYSSIIRLRSSTSSASVLSP